MSRRSLLILLLALGALVGIPSIASAAGLRPEDYFSAAEIARADRYRSTAYLLGFSALGLTIATAGLLGLGRGARILGAWSARLTRDRWVRRTALLALVASLVPILIVLPLSAARHSHDRRYGLATNSLFEHLLDVGRASMFEVGIGVMAALVFVWVARRLPRLWPVVTAAAGIVLTVALVYLFPVVYEPVFNDFVEVDPSTRARVLALADDAGVEIHDVLVADASRRTTRQNAYVSGIGATRRVVLYDTLLAKSPPDQVDVVVAHELMHQKNNDVLIGTVYASGGVVLGVGALAFLLRRRGRLRRSLAVEGAGDPGVVPFLAFFLVGASLVSQPVVSGLSRRVEARADRGAIAITRDPQAAVDLQVGLARDNISDLMPNPAIVWLFFSHPPVLDRIEIALEGAEASKR